MADADLDLVAAGLWSMTDEGFRVQHWSSPPSLAALTRASLILNTGRSDERATRRARHWLTGAAATYGKRAAVKPSKRGRRG